MNRTAADTVEPPAPYQLVGYREVFTWLNLPDDRPWKRVDSPAGSPLEFIVSCLCYPLLLTADPADLERSVEYRDVTLRRPLWESKETGQRLYYWAGQCPGCEVIYWSAGLVTG